MAKLASPNFTTFKYSPTRVSVGTVDRMNCTCAKSLDITSKYLLNNGIDSERSFQIVFIKQTLSAASGTQNHFAVSFTKSCKHRCC